MNTNMINKLMKISLNGQQVIDLTGEPKTNLISYADIHKYKSLDDLLGKTQSCIILYETSQNYGHWICVFRYLPPNENKIEVFDSYGRYKPDDELKFIPKQFAKISKQDYPYLTKLLYDSGYEIEYNDHKYQSYKNLDISTCGRYAGCRLFFRDMDLDEFNQIFELYKEYKPDVLITLLSELIYKHNI